MRTLHIYHNRHLRSVINNFNENDVIIVHNKITRDLINHLFKINNIEVLNLTYITIKELLEGKIDNMKFDYIVGNPPYQDNNNSDAGSLYIDITKKVLPLLTEQGVIDFITPTTIAQVKRQGFSIKGIKGLKIVDYTVDNSFDVGVKILRWQIDKTYNGLVTITDSDGVVTKRPYTDMMVESKDIFGFELFEKIKDNKNKMFFQERLFHGDQSTNNNRTKTCSKEYPYEVIVNKLKNKIEYSKVKPKLFGRTKIVVHMGAVYNEKNYEISDKDYGQYQNLIDITNNTDKEIENIKTFLFNDICINICKKYRTHYKTGMNNILYNFPKIDVTKKYTDKDVQKVFNLTDEEVEWLMS